MSALYRGHSFAMVGAPERDHTRSQLHLAAIGRGAEAAIVRSLKAWARLIAVQAGPVSCCVESTLQTAT